MLFSFIFYVKTKTPYVMRISYWSSDVCSPDLTAPPSDPRVAAAEQARIRAAQEGDAARASRLFLGGAVGAAPVSSLLGEGTSLAAVPAAQAGGSATDRRRGFFGEANARAAESAARLTKPSSPHVVQAGSVIPAALITGIR